MNVKLLILVILTIVKSIRSESTTDLGFTDDQYTGNTNAETSTATTTTETDMPQVNYCSDLLPYCSCFLSSVFIKCDQFDSFSQLDFKSLQNGSEPKKIYELELSPINPIILDSMLDLTGIELYNDVKLRNIKGFEFKSNPFDSVRNGKGLNLYMYDSALEFYEDSKLESKLDCSNSANTTIISPVFKAFNFIQIENVSSKKICPIVFKNVALRSLNLNYILLYILI